MSGLPWFKLYTEARTDAKLRTLTDEEFRIWFNLLCFAAEQPERGVIKNYDEELLAIECNALPALLRVTLVTLTKLHIVSCTDERVTFCAFARRQEVKPSDAPDRIKARVAKHRANKKQENVTPRNAMKRLDKDRDKEEEYDRTILSSEESSLSVAVVAEPEVTVDLVEDRDTTSEQPATMIETAAAAVLESWNDVSLSQSAERIRSILHLPRESLATLKTTLRQYPCAPPYLEGEAASCADYYANVAHKKASITGFNRWMHRAERERLTPLTSSPEGKQKNHDQSTNNRQRTSTSTSASREHDDSPKHLADVAESRERQREAARILGQQIAG